MHRQTHRQIENSWKNQIEIVREIEVKNWQRRFGLTLLQSGLQSGAFLAICQFPSFRREKGKIKWEIVSGIFQRIFELEKSPRSFVRSFVWSISFMKCRPRPRARLQVTFLHNITFAITLFLSHSHAINSNLRLL